MNFAASILTMNFHGVAIAAADRFLFGAVAGTLLAVTVWFLLQLFPGKDSRTSFAVWFATLLATALLPALGLYSRASLSADKIQNAGITVSASWALAIFIGWAVIAAVGLARVGLATLQLRKLRKQAAPVNMDELDPALRGLVEGFQQSRSVALLMSEHLEVPTAIGFHKPAIILPAWLLASTPAEELKYILLHEMAHLSRRDDWTNLAQKVLKAILFFLPSVWWIERKLSLDREMACDDAVLARSASARGYAECLARVAERSFLRRQLALAQAAVGRVRQLTTRVAMILDPNRPKASGLWKPAIPVVVVLTGLSAVPASMAPTFVHFSDNTVRASVSAAGATAPVKTENFSAAPKLFAASKTSLVQAHANPENLGVRAVQASLRTDSDPARVKEKSVHALRQNVAHTRPVQIRKAVQPPSLVAVAGFPLLQPQERQMNGTILPEQQQYVTVREELVVMVTRQTPTGEQQGWQMHFVQISVKPQLKAKSNKT
jgi:beta-lactamase regulating signal transducer with metallopeptidase domain